MDPNIREINVIIKNPAVNAFYEKTETQLICDCCKKGLHKRDYYDHVMSKGHKSKSGQEPKKKPSAKTDDSTSKLSIEFTY